MFLYLLACLALPILFDYLILIFSNGSITIKGVNVYPTTFYSKLLEQETKVLYASAGKLVATALNFRQRADICGCVSYYGVLLFTVAYNTMATLIKALFPIEDFVKSYNEIRIFPKQFNLSQSVILTDLLNNMSGDESSDGESSNGMTVPDIQTEPPIHD